MLEPGDRAPELELTHTAGTRALQSFAGSALVLFFYPRDNTPGCTTENQQFAALHADFLACGAVLLGVSRDSLASHQKFRAKHELPFDLVSDADGSVCEAFDVMREKTLYGRKHIGIERSTFLFDSGLILRHSWRKLKVPGHAQAVLDALKAL